MSKQNKNYGLKKASQLEQGVKVAYNPIALPQYPIHRTGKKLELGELFPGDTYTVAQVILYGYHMSGKGHRRSHAGPHELEPHELTGVRITDKYGCPLTNVMLRLEESTGELYSYKLFRPAE